MSLSTRGISVQPTYEWLLTESPTSPDSERP